MWHPLAGGGGGGGKVDHDIDPVAQNRSSSSSHHSQVNLHVKFESDRTKTAVCIMTYHKVSYTEHQTYMSYFSGAILGFSGNFSGTNDIFLGQILQLNSGTLSGTF